MNNADFRAVMREAQSRYGIHLPPEYKGFVDRTIAFDAQPVAITAANAGIPAYLANYLEPGAIRVLVQPMKAEEIFGSQKKGDWTTLTAQFRQVESMGETSAYEDYSEQGQSSSNNNWIPRQSFHFQTFTNWGERELAIAGEGQIDLAGDNNIASILTLQKVANRIAFFGVANLQNYGALNDPSLTAPIAPAASGTSGGTLWSTKDGGEIYDDIVDLYVQLIAQTSGLVDRNSAMTLALSPDSEAYFTRTNMYNVNVSDQLTKNFPNLKVKTAVEYATQSGNLVQLIADELEGKRTAVSCFTEKLRAHPVVIGSSSFRQKKSSGHWGTIIFRPFAIAQMLGV